MVDKADSAHLGFGSGNLYGGKDRARSLALIRAALDSGIAWIDTAPLYGHGAAEGIVGEAIAGRRDDIVLVSKVGVEPTHITFSHRVRSKISSVFQHVPGGGAMFTPPPPLRPQFHCFEPDDVRRSVERSLIALGTDRLDYLLLHEVKAEDALREALRDQLAALRSEGKIVAYGTATQPDATCAIAASDRAGECALFQVPKEGFSDVHAAMQRDSGAGIVMHSILGGGLGRVLQALKSDDAVRRFAVDLSVDPDHPDLASRLMAYWLMHERVRAVLFSTTQVERVRLMAGARNIPAVDARAGALLLEKALEYLAGNSGPGRRCD